MGGIKAHYDCIKAFSETDFTEDLKKIDVPSLVMHGDDDQIVPIADSALLSAKLVKNGTLKVYPGLPHGMCTTHADVINAICWRSSRAELSGLRFAAASTAARPGPVDEEASGSLLHLLSFLTGFVPYKRVHNIY